MSFSCIFCLIAVSLVVRTCAIDYLERLISEATYYVLSGMLNSSWSLMLLFFMQISKAESISSCRSRHFVHEVILNAALTKTARLISW